jgi:hypothetical protein
VDRHNYQTGERRNTMTSNTDVKQTMQQLATASDAASAQIIGLAAIIAHLPGVSQLQDNAVDAAIEHACRHLGRQVDDRASEFAHSILRTAREFSTSAVASPHEEHMRGYERGT